MLAILFLFPILFFYIVTSLPEGHISSLLEKICILTYLPLLYLWTAGMQNLNKQYKNDPLSNHDKC